MHTAPGGRSVPTTVTDREVLRAAARAIRSVMGRRQASGMLTAGGVWVEPDPELLALAVECDAVVFGRRAEPDDLAPRLAAVLGDGWEPPSEGASP